MMILSLFEFVGKTALKNFRFFGRYVLFIVQTAQAACTTQLKVNKLFTQMDKIGIQSFPIAILTTSFAGGIIALLAYASLKQFGSEHLIGQMVALIMTRELGPVFTGLMVAGRCSSGIAAEIGTMRITEEIDALETLCINKFQYLIVPRVLASIIMLPFLTVFSMAFGVIGGYAVCVFIFGLNPVDYIDGIKEMLTAGDIISGLIKSAVFGFILSSIGAFKGYYTWGGAKGVGIATTESMVSASIAIVISDFFLSVLLFGGA